MNKFLVFCSICSISVAYTVHEGYYPSEIGGYYSNIQRPEYIGGPIGYEGYSPEIYGPRYIERAPLIPRPIQYQYPLHGYGGELIDKTNYRKGNENYNDGGYEKATGQEEQEVDHGQHGYNRNQAAFQEGQGDSGHYSNVEGRKNAFEDGKEFTGSEYHGQKGAGEEAKKQQQGHKKGHTVKGFKTSHHKDESGKTEEFYDEANDEGDHFNFDGRSGSFKEDGGSSFKGGHEDGESNENIHQKGGYYDNNHFVDKVNADQGKFGGNKFANNGRVYGRHNGVDQESLLGNQETSKFYKHSPYLNHFYRQ